MIENYLDVISSNKCTGCGACLNSCPFDAIKKEEDEYGFWYPVVDKNKCKNCGKCEKACPILHSETHKMPNICYAVMANTEIRMKSSSGGIFTLVAQNILNKNGYVCGAAFSNDWNVEHIIINNIEDLDKLRTSKYIQSTIGNAYSEIKTLLENNKPVLFTGTPCQVAGLYSFLGKDYNNLITIDFACHGVPSQKIWQTYLNENFDKSQIKKINFRDKFKKGWSCTNKFTMKNGENIIEQTYFRGFSQNLYLRSSCYNCNFAKYERCSDLTIADFWGIKKYNPKYTDGKGTSVLLINTKKGNDLINQVKSECILFESIPSEVLINQFKKLGMHKGTPEHPNREKFFKDFKEQKMKFNDMVNKNLCTHDVGLVGVYTTQNYGNQSQYYALYKTIQDLGYSVLMIDRPLSSNWKPKGNVPFLFRENPYNEKDLSKLYKNKDEMKKELNQIASKFLIGSDQFFRKGLYHACGEYMDLDWVNDNKPKSAYAISFGINKFEGSKKTRLKVAYNLNRLNYVSVREESGVKLLQNQYYIENPQLCIDPVFLVNKTHYLELISKSDIDVGKNYLLAFILDNNNTKNEIIYETAEKLGLKIKLIKNARTYIAENNLKIYIEDWLKYYYYSDFVITDSFHGLCFALIFRKQFLFILNKKRGITRFETLINLFGIGDRAIENYQEVEEKISKKIDYSIVDSKIDKYRTSSLDFLKKALAEDVAIPHKLNPILEKELKKLKTISIIKYYIYKTLFNFTFGETRKKIKAKKIKYKNFIKHIK